MIWHEANLLDGDELLRLIKTVRASHLLHFAWDVTPGKFWNSEINEMWLAASTALSRAFWEQGGERAVGIGTCAEYAWHAGDVICDERFTPIQPSTKYGAAKHALYLAMAQHAALVDGSLAWARLFFQYGPGEPKQKFVASAIRSLLNKSHFRVESSNQQRDWLFVQDVADACIAILDSEFCGALNVGGGILRTNRDLLSAIVRFTGNVDCIEFGDKPSDSNNPLKLIPNLDALFKKIKWHPEYSLDVGMKETIDFWKDTDNLQPKLDLMPNF